METTTPYPGATISAVATPILSVEDTAQLLGIGRAAAYAAVKRGELPSIRIGRRVYVPRAKLNALLGIDAPADEVL